MSKFTLLNASAGSGKTHRITLELLRLILPNPSEISRVLSITFTNKAANEMKERLISSLSDMTYNPETSKMLNALTIEFPQKSKTELCQMADRALKHILHHYSDISISTIDSFMQRIIRTFARELSLPSNYEVKVNDKELNEIIISKIIDSANLNDIITRVLKEVIRYQLDNDSSPLNLTNELLPLVQHLTIEASTDIVNSALEIGSYNIMKSFDVLLANNRNTLSRITSNIKNLNSILSNENLTENDFYKSGNAITIYRYIKSLSKDINTKNLSVTMQKKLDSGQFLLNPNPAVESKIQKLIFETTDLISKYKFGNSLAKRFPVVALLGEIWAFREKYKFEKSILPVSDFNRIIREIIKKEPVPYIYLRAGNRFKTIMIDEFQDTSFMQWMNLLPLIHESLSRGNSSWVVGDPKQSIYRFRNGKVEIMLGLPKIYEGDADTIESQNLIESAFNKEDMLFNYRSDINIVDFNSKFYSFIKSRFLNYIEENKTSNEQGDKLNIYKEVYNQIEQKPNAQTKGYVECRIYNKELKDLNGLWFEDIAQIVRNCIDLGYNYSDIAILNRDNKYGVSISSYFLSMGNPIPVISKETLQLRSSNYCLLVMCMYRLIHCPEDDLNAIETWYLMQQIPGISFDDSHEIKGILSLNKNGRGLVLQKYIKQKFEAIGSGSFVFLPPSDQIDIIIHSLDISKQGGFFLLFLRETIMNKQQSDGYNSSLIWQWWTEKGQFESVVLPDAGNAVNIMSIHASKGLQFPIVIIPNFNIDDTSKIVRDLYWHLLDEKEWGVPYSIVKLTKESLNNELNDQYVLEYSKRAMDTVNLMYVASTRAEEKLFIFSFLPPKKKESEKSAENNTESKFQVNSAKELQSFIKSNINLFDEKNEALFTSYTIGDFSCKRAIKQTDKNKFLLSSFNINPNKPLDSLRRNAIGFDSLELRESAIKGKIMHELLSNIYEKDNVLPVMENYMQNGWLEESSKDEYLKYLNKVVDDFPFIFPGKKFVLNEREIADTDGTVWRPDRIICNSDGICTVIDFKTGSKKAAHKTQVQNYSMLLNAAGIKVNQSYILYLDIDNFETSLEKA